jgi:hypothetical protein
MGFFFSVSTVMPWPSMDGFNSFWWGPTLFGQVQIIKLVQKV